jgi:hypothetical protein
VLLPVSEGTAECVAQAETGEHGVGTRVFATPSEFAIQSFFALLALIVRAGLEYDREVGLAVQHVHKIQETRFQVPRFANKEAVAAVHDAEDA